MRGSMRATTAASLLKTLLLLLSTLPGVQIADAATSAGLYKEQFDKDGHRLISEDEMKTHVEKLFTECELTEFYEEGTLTVEYQYLGTNDVTIRGNLPSVFEDKVYAMHN
eukprot:SAG22_NODE_10038_length_556_cov_2.433260_1_plen_109_part_01